MSGDRELDVVIFGATGFAGRLVAGYLAGHAPGGVRIGLAGRSARRLADVRAGLGEAASAWPLLTADSADPVSVAALARAARVVVSTVGPYRTQGLALVEACAEPPAPTLMPQPPTQVTLPYSVRSASGVTPLVS